VHYSENDGYGFRGRKENHPVEFDVTKGLKGPQAVHVA
jgi:cold shock CspA family protein